MPKVNDKFESQHIENLSKYGKLIDSVYRKATEEAAAIAMIVPNFNADKVFSFADYPITSERVKKLLNTLAADTQTVIVNGIDAEWTLANNKNNELARFILGDRVGKLSQSQYQRFFNSNEEAHQAFLKRREQGMNLSDRVWRYTGMFQNDIEMGVDLGLRNGLSAAEMSRDLRQFLQHPDMLFRRVRDEHGNLVLSKRAAAYHCGTGVYRSSYMNARRLAVTETNIAFRTADFERIQQFDFVVGIEVCLSNNHNCKGFPTGAFSDICDELAGRYPKTFKFTGWHPHCRCHVKTVLKTENEVMEETRAILAGREPSKNSENLVANMPDSFMGWLDENAERIERAKALPYFLRDNGRRTGGKYELTIEMPNTQPSPLEIAKKRHENRTAAQVAAIKEAWAKRKHDMKVTETTAANVLNVAQDYAEVEYAELQAAIAAKDYAKMKAETKATALSVLEVKNAEKALGDVIPDAHKWHKQFSISELEAVKKAALKTYEGKATKYYYNSWADIPLEKKKKLLEFEINWVEQNKKYSTWQVSKAIYQKELNLVNEQLAWQSTELHFASVKAYLAQHTSAFKLTQLIQEAEALKASGASVATVEAKLAEADKRIKGIEDAAKKRANAKAAKHNVGGSPFSAEAYTVARRKAAFWERNGNSTRVDDLLRKTTEEAWAAMGKGEKEALTAYTEGSGHMNRPLRGYLHTWDNFKGVGKVDLDAEGGKKHINDATKAISRSRSKQDMWLNRGWDSRAGVSAFLGKPYDEIMGMSQKELDKAFLGKEIKDEGFTSCGTMKGTGFSGYLKGNIYCPKGTQMIYAEPFSRFNGDSLSSYNLWDGKSKYVLENEFETIIQRGTTYKITKIYIDNGRLYVDMDVVAQL